ncbi:hypothetical protein CYMTET_23594 [Cymbomonas tetramitiformis]|uniref:EF-hand domain-containing protein n=1 Tax=Cymbomonas tetramitiformis TaxID=36881 RepID=A0AAE0L139_9CHLO|nr:hypothetical protein CYMTET_23594 [Cymbomonas tetramitiformis]
MTSPTIHPIDSMTEENVGGEVKKRLLLRETRLYLDKWWHKWWPESLGREYRTPMGLLLNDPESSRLASTLSNVLALLIISSVVVLTLQTVKGYENGWHPVERFFNYLFTLEILVRVRYQYDHPVGCIFDMYFYVDVLAVLPFWLDELGQTAGDGPLNVLKALRMLRLLKASRHFMGTITLVQTISQSTKPLIVPIFFLCCAVLVFASLIFYIEEEAAKATGVTSAFQSIPQASWFMMVTMTTVGYGDISPNTSLGKFVCLFAMFFGVLFLSMPLAIMGKNYCMVWQDRYKYRLVTKLQDVLCSEGVTRESINNIFQKLDVDGNGSLSFKEFKGSLRALHVKMTHKVLQQLWGCIDYDQSGEVDIKEFVELMFTGISDPDVEDHPEDDLDNPDTPTQKYQISESMKDGKGSGVPPDRLEWSYHLKKNDASIAAMKLQLADLQLTVDRVCKLIASRDPLALNETIT